MSVEHYDCDCCGDNGVYEEGIHTCEKCGKKICNKCIDETFKDYDDFFKRGVNEDGELLKKYCQFCSGDKINDTQRVDKLLDMCNIDIEELDEIILKDRRSNK